MTDGIGMIHLYTGDGKGKTTAALGLAFRAAGHGLRTLVVQFMKCAEPYGENRSASLFEGITIMPMGRSCLIDADAPEKEDIEAAGRAVEVVSEAMRSGEWDIVVLDEVNVAVKWNLVTEQEVLDALRNKGDDVEVVLTGRYAPPSFHQIADVITEMRKLRHPYDRGVLSREGIDR